MVILMELVFSVAASAVPLLVWSPFGVDYPSNLLSVLLQCDSSKLYHPRVVFDCELHQKMEKWSNWILLRDSQFQLGCWVGELMDLYFDQPSVEMIITVRLVSQLSFTGDKSGQFNLYLIWVWAHWAMSTIELRSCNNKRRRDNHHH